MDAKSLAKSKRAHSQQHSKKPHQSPKPKSTSDSRSNAANSKKPLSKQLREKAHQSQRVSALPSNFDRYEEQLDSDSESVSASNAAQVSDAVLPKSKGADYNYLISEAHSHALSNPYPDDFPSLSDVLPGDFNQFVGSMISARGENILSWTGDDNFVVEDKTSGTHEALFFSLNLHALAQQLEKIDLCQRLFIEEDVLPPEMRGGNVKATNHQEPEQMQTNCESGVAPQTNEGLLLSEFSQRFHISDKDLEQSSPHSGSNHQESTFLNADLDLKDRFKDDFHPLSLPVESREQDSGATGNVNSIEATGKKLSNFEARVAEAELDMLLDSFNEAKPCGSSDIKGGSTTSDLQKEISAPLLQLPRNVTDLSKTAAAMAVDFDDELDSLLAETSSNELCGKGSSVVGHALGKGASMSKTSAAGAGLDEPLDKFLQGTSYLAMQKDSPQLSKADDAAVVKASSSSSHVTKSKVMDDFNSWFDTI